MIKDRGKALFASVLQAQYFRFLAMGGIAALVNVISRFLLSMITSYSIAIVIAYAIGMLVAFILFQAFVFERTTRSQSHQVTWFVLVNLAGIVQVWLVSIGLARLLFPALGWTWHGEDIAHIIGVAVPAVTSYFGHRLLSFRPAREP